MYNYNPRVLLEDTKRRHIARFWFFCADFVYVFICCVVVNRVTIYGQSKVKSFQNVRYIYMGWGGVGLGEGIMKLPNTLLIAIKVYTFSHFPRYLI